MDLASSSDLQCKKAITVTASMSSEECELRMKMWLLRGRAIPAEGPWSRYQHVHGVKAPKIGPLLTAEQCEAALALIQEGEGAPAPPPRVLEAALAPPPSAPEAAPEAAAAPRAAGRRRRRAPDAALAAQPAVLFDDDAPLSALAAAPRAARRRRRRDP